MTWLLVAALVVNPAVLVEVGNFTGEGAHRRCLDFAMLVNAADEIKVNGQWLVKDTAECVQS
jgi:hypothetical protein